jgi:hypothetical protein
MTVSSVVPIWNETLVADARIRTGLTVQGFGYPLEVLAEVDPIGVKTRIRALYALRIPKIDFAFYSHAPTVASGVSINPPTKNIQFSLGQPEISVSVQIEIPLTNINHTMLQALYVGQFNNDTFVAIENTVNVSLSSSLPVINTGTSLDIPAKNYNLNKFIPRVPGWGPDIIATTGTSGTQASGPFNAYYRRYIIVATYTSAEMSTACGGALSATIRGMRIYVSNAPSASYQPFPGYSIGAKNTTEPETQSNSGSTGGTFTLVKGPSNESFTALTTKEFIFDTPIEWTGSNFVFSWAWCQIPTGYTDAGSCPVGSGSRYSAFVDNAGCYSISSVTSSTQSGRPVLQLLYT